MNWEEARLLTDLEAEEEARMTRRIEELEAKLAKATDTLSRIVRGDDDADNWAIWTLAELKGDKQP